MALTDILKGAYHSVQNVVRPAVLGLALAHCGPSVDDSDSRGCRADYDCREPRVCERGICVTLEEDIYNGNDKLNPSDGMGRKKEERTKSACESGEVLFEDNFNGKELNPENWGDEDSLFEIPFSKYMRLNNGVLEMRVTNIDFRGESIWLHSNIYFEFSGYESLCLSGRLRVLETEGTGFTLAMQSNESYRIHLSDNSGTLYCGRQRPLTATAPTCSVEDAAKFHTYTIEYQYKGGFPEDIQAYYIDGERQKLAKKTFSSFGFRTYLSCDGIALQGNSEEKVCFIDYVKITGLK